MKKNKTKVLILRTAGTNCDKETAHAFSSLGAKVDFVHINKLFSKEIDVNNYNLLAISGGFSYGDDVAAGRVLANELKFKLYNSLKKFVKDKKLIIGICNGFQVLIKSGLLPGFKAMDEKQYFTLAFNDSDKFECRWVKLQTQKCKSPFLTYVPDGITLPVAHAEGKFVSGNDTDLKKLENNNQVAFRYSDNTNPNGSINDIAGICSKDGNILGLMPHPERFFSWHQYTKWTSEKSRKYGDGYYIFKSAVDHINKTF